MTLHGVPRARLVSSLTMVKDVFTSVMLDGRKQINRAGAVTSPGTVEVI